MNAQTLGEALWDNKGGHQDQKVFLPVSTRRLAPDKTANINNASKTKLKDESLTTDELLFPHGVVFCVSPSPELLHRKSRRCLPRRKRDLQMQNN